MKTPEIREAPVPVRGWHVGCLPLSDALKAVCNGWPVLDIDDAQGEIDCAVGGGVAFIMSDESIVIARAKP